MANIQTFQTPQLGLTPSETGVESEAAAARRAGSFYNQAAESIGAAASIKNDMASRLGSGISSLGNAVVDMETRREVGHGAATFAQLQDSLTNQWNDLAKNADPNDASVAAKFRDGVLETALENFSGAFSTEKGQQWADEHIAALRQHMFQKTQSDMATLAGIAVKKNVTDSATAMSNTAITDPTSVPFLLESVDHNVNGIVNSSPNLKGVDAARVRDEVSEQTKAAIVKSGAQGAIRKSANPEATADDWIKKYPTYINGDEAKALAANARSEIRARNYDVEQNRRRAKEDAQDRSANATQQYLIDVRSQDPRLANDPTAQKILHDTNLTKQDKNNLLNYIDRQTKPETDARTSQQTFVGLLRDLRNPDANPDQIMQKAWDARLTDPGKTGALSERDFNQFREEVVARKTPEGAALERDRALFFKQYAGAIAGAGYDPVVGSPKLYTAEMDARRMEATLKQKSLDPHLAYDPASEYFLGKAERLAKYQGSMQTDLHDQAPAEVPTARPGAREPGIYNTPKGRLRWTGTGWVQP